MTKNPESYGVLPATGYMRQSQLIPAIFPFSPATLWRKVKEGTFPKPIKLAPRITAWRVEDIRDLLYRGEWAVSNLPSPARFGASSLCTSDSEGEGRSPQTDSADLASSRLSSGKVRAQ
jgi:hypothetical protein